MIDFHTHILPNVDDGSDSVNKSIELLNILKNDGVKLVCLTSHFYPKQESIDEFIERRNNAFSLLNYKDLELRLGAEIHYYRGISVNDDIAKLCIDNTNILLIELSFSTVINDNVIKELINLKNRGFKILLAHIERYDISEDQLINMHNNGILFQCNSEMFTNFFLKRKALKWLKSGLIDVIGSDAHNTNDRRPNYAKAMNIIKDKFGTSFYDNFIEKTYNIIGTK